MNYSSANDSIINAAIWNANFENALELINQYRQEKLSDNDNALLLLKTVDIYLLLGNYSAAGTAFAEAEKTMYRIENPGPTLQFQYAFQKARYFNYAGRSTDAFTWLKRAENKLNNFNRIDSDDIARLYSELGKYNYEHNNYAESVRYYQLAVTKQNGGSISDKIKIANYNACLANSCWFNNESERAAELVESSLNFLNAFTEPIHPALLDVYLSLGDYCIKIKNDIVLTDRLLLNATSILNKTYPANHYKYGILYYLKGITEYYKDDSENALFYCNHALNIANVNPILSQYQVLNYALLACINYFFKRDYGKAIDYCNMAITTKQNNNPSIAYFYYLKGLSYKRLKDIQFAMNYFNKAVLAAFASKSPDDHNICSLAYFELSKIFSINTPETGYKYLNKALFQARMVSEKSDNIVSLYYNLSFYHYLKGNYHKALTLVQQSIIAACQSFNDTSILMNPLPTDVQNTNSVVDCFTLKAYLLFKLYDDSNKNLAFLNAAMHSQELAVKLTERRVININDENSRLTINNAKKKGFDNAVSYATLLYMATGDRTYAEKALGYAEKSKMQLLFLYTQNENNMFRSGIPDSLIKKEDTLEIEILEIENRFALAEKTVKFQDNNPDLLQKLAGLYDQRDELTNRMEANYPAYYQLKYNFRVAGLDEIQQLPDDDQVILEYQLLETELILFMITHNDIRIHRQFINKEIYENIDRLRACLASDPLGSGYRSSFEVFVNSSYYLYTKLIEPVKDKIREKRLIIIPHNALTLLPFEILITEKPANTKLPNYKTLNYLIKENPIVYAFSANLLLDNNQGKKYGSGTAVFLPDYKSYKGKKEQATLPDLEGAALEASVIRKVSHGRMFNGPLAKENVFKEKADRYRVLHIAAHTLIDEKNPMLSGLVMTAPSDSVEDGYLYAYELSQLNLSAQLVVLSGCNTGYGVLRNNEGLISIARSFFYTGVRTLGFTLWPVADNAGALLTGDFYRNLKRHQNVDEALREAKLKFLENADPVKAHPFYWAGYVIVGKTENVPLRRFPAWPLFAAVSIVVFLLSAIIYRRFRV